MTSTIKDSENLSHPHLTNDEEKQIYGHNLHGCFVFDNYIPISCPPSKGLDAPLQFITKDNLSLITDAEDCINILETMMISFPITDDIESSRSSFEIIPTPESSLFIQDSFTAPVSRITESSQTISKEQSSCQMGSQNSNVIDSFNPVINIIPITLSDTLYYELCQLELSIPNTHVSSLTIQKISYTILRKRREWLRTFHIPDTQTSPCIKLKTKESNIFERKKTHSISSRSNISDSNDAVDKPQWTFLNSAIKTIKSSLKSSDLLNNQLNKTQPLSSNDSIEQTHALKPMSLENSVLSDHSIVEKPDDLGELYHVQDFITTMLSQKKVTGVSSELKQWLSNIEYILKCLQHKTNSFSTIIIPTLSSKIIPNRQNDTSYFLKQLNISYYLSSQFQENLTMPSIFCMMTLNELLQLYRLVQQQRIQRGIVTPITLHIGDHIYREILDKGALKYLTHHGIYTGNGRIIHFSGNEYSMKSLLFSGKTTASIRVTTINHFVKRGSRLRIRQYNKCDAVELTLSRAEQALMEQTFPEYHLFKNNCEHFCHYCKTGKSRSKQVERGVQYATAAGVVATAAFAVGMTMAQRKK